MDYLAGLPAGLLSHPECQTRAGLLATFLASAPQREAEPFVVSLLQPSSGGWIPEVRFHAALLAIADGGQLSEAQYLSWVRTTNGEAYRGLVYRALMAMFSPAQLLERAAARWEAFHRGTQVSVTSARAGEVQVEVTFPPRLYTPLILRGYAEAFAAAFEHSRGRDVTMELVGSSDTAGHFLGRWR